MRSTFTFNGHSCDEFGIYISKKPNINRSQRKFQSASVAGRNGNIYQLQDAWDEVVVTYDIFAGGYEQGDAPSDFTDIMEWLNSADDYARLEDSYDTEHYRMAVFVDATNIEQKWYSTGQAQIKFRCKPQHFLDIPDVDVNNLRNYYMGEIVSFDGDGQNLENLTAEIKAVQSGSGDPSPDNVRPISGWSSVKVCVTGKNLIPLYSSASYVTGGLTVARQSDGGILVTGTSTKSSAGINNISGLFLLPAGDYVLSGNDGDSSVYHTYTQLRLRKSVNGSLASLKSGDGNFSLTEPTLVQFGMYIGSSSQAVNVNYEYYPMIRERNTSGDFEPYNGQTYTIDLDGTRYGGSIDVTTGVLTITHEIVDLGNLTWIKQTNASWNCFSSSITGKKNGGTVICSNYPQGAIYGTSTDKIVGVNANSNNIYVRDSSYMSGDATAFKTAMSGVQLVYELDTPQTVQLTPQQVKTLVGENNIWVDSGEVDVVTAPSIANPTNHVALPIITLTGAGASSLLDLEKDSPDHNESGMPYYFSELLPCFGAVLTGMSGSQRYVSMFTDAYAEIDKLQIASRQNSTGSVVFTALNDDYGVGTAIEVNPNTDYTISATTDRACTVQVLFFTGVVGLITSEAHASNNGGGLQLTFRTPSDCQKILIAFFASDTSQITVSSIMVNKGTEALPFRAFTTDTSETITIKDTTLKILMNGFKTAVIDCERENFSVDGADSNTSVSVLDQYGNLSDEYLKIDKGRNKVAYSDGIVSVMLKPRFWEL